MLAAVSWKNTDQTDHEVGLGTILLALAALIMAVAAYLLG